MRSNFCLYVAAALLSVVAAFAAPPVPTLRLPETAVPLEYKASLTLDPAKKTFNGNIAISLEFRQSTDFLWLNGAGLDVKSATLTMGGEKLNAKPVVGDANFLGFQFPKTVGAGNGMLTIDYVGQVRQKDSSALFHMEEDGADYLFTQFESTDARGAFPCFDEPSYKVPWQLTLDVPASQVAISNTSPQAERKAGNRKIITFAKTKPLPSYLVALAVGPLEFVDGGKAGKNGIPVRIVTPKGHREEAQYAAGVTATIINRLENYFGIPFPYDKSDQVAIPVTYGFGAMENAGMVTYAQNIILARPDRDTEARRRGYATTAAHELAHQWFGDLVTTAWWNDIWLNEAFATWMEQKLIRDWKPEWNTSVQDANSKLYAEGEDSLASARKIRQEIVTNDDISNAFDGITYEKGAAVIGMFENYLGEQDFRSGVQSYLKAYSFRNASAPQFLDAISTASGKNITSAFSTFLNQSGVPLLSVSLDCKGDAAVLHVTQERYTPLGAKNSSAPRWQIPLCVRYGKDSDNTGQSFCQIISSDAPDVVLHGAGCPTWVEADSKARGYYIVNYSPPLRSALESREVQARLSAPERVNLMGNSVSLVEAGKLPLGDALGMVQAFSHDPALPVIANALKLALQPSGHLIDENLEPGYQRFLQKNFRDLAHQLTWQPSANEADDQRLLRPRILRAVATAGGDRDLASQASDLTHRWLADHKAIDPSVVSAVLGTAAFYGNKDLVEQFITQLKASKDHQDRTRIIGAIESFRDPAAIQTGFQALLSGDIPFIEGISLLFAGQGYEPTRTLGFDFLRAHFDELTAKRPTGGGFDSGSLFPRTGDSFCSSAQKTELSNFFEPRVGKFVGAPRALAQVLEGIDVCIATQQSQKTSLQAFLQSY